MTFIEMQIKKLLDEEYVVKNEGMKGFGWKEGEERLEEAARYSLA